MIHCDSDHIRVKGHCGTWYAIDEGWYAKGETKEHLFLLEHETYGDEAAHVIVNERGDLVLEDVWNGFDDLEYEGWTPLDGGG